jgi:hypothetical protein
MSKPRASFHLPSPSKRAIILKSGVPTQRLPDGSRRHALAEAEVLDRAWAWAEAEGRSGAGLEWLSEVRLTTFDEMKVMSFVWGAEAVLLVLT